MKINKNDEKSIFIGIIIFSLVIRVATLEFINPSDCAYYWFAGKLLVYNQDYLEWMKTFSLAHQATRFGLIIPLYILQKLFGTSLYVFYILPVTVSVIATGLIFLIGNKIKNVYTGIISSVLFVIFPPMIRNGSQLFPDILAAVYILSAFYLLLIYHDSEKKSKVYILAGALLCFFAYLTKEPAIFLVFGFAIAIIIIEKGIKELILFGIFFSLLFATESVFYYHNFGDFLGRFHIVQSKHLSQDFEALKSFFGLFNRYIEVPVYWKLTFFTYLGLLCYLFFRDKKSSNSIKAFSVIGFSFFFCITFAVKSFKPLIPAQNFGYRYLDSGLPFIMIIIGYYIDYFFITKNSEDKNTWLNGGLQKSNIIKPAVLAMVFLVGYIVAFNFLYQKARYGENGDKISHPFLIIDEYSSKINQLYQSGVPVVFKSDYRRKMFCLFLHVILDQKSIPPESMLNLPVEKSFKNKNHETMYYYVNSNKEIKNESDLNACKKYIYVDFKHHNFFYKVINKSDHE